MLVLFLRPASRKPPFAQSSKLMASESTAWKLPSKHALSCLLPGSQPKTPVPIEVSKPLMIAGTNSLGIDPPKGRFELEVFAGFSASHSASAGPISNWMSANLPRPPDCFNTAVADRSSESFFISNLGVTLVYFYFKFTAHTIDNDLQVQLTHSTKDGLPVSSSVFTRNVGSSSTSLAIAMPILSTSACVLGSTATAITGSGINMFSRVIGWFSSQRVSPVLISLKPTAAAISPASIKSIGILLVGKHLHDTADTFFLTASYVQYIRTCVEVTTVTAEERQTAHERIGHDLKSQRSKRFFRVWLTNQFLACFQDRYLCIRNINRRRQVAANTIQCSLHTLVFKGTTAHHGNNAQVERGATNRFMNFLFCDLWGSSKNFSSNLSSYSATASIRFCLHSSASACISAGIGISL